MSVYMADDDQLKELMKYISDHLQMPLLGFGGGAEFVIGDPWFHDVAIGTQIPGWLYADGSVYNIADYPQLAAHYASHHGSANFYGGDGVTTFAVPDLRGEFIRGCGTNSHANQGSGENVGVHQDATAIPSITMLKNSGITNNIALYARGRQDYSNSSVNYDAMVKSTGDVYDYTFARNGVISRSGEQEFARTTRPTNTSYPIYIKATVGHTYSTDEQPVGTDTDGSVVYEKTFIIDSGITSNTSIFLLDGINGIVDYNIIHYISAWNAWVGNYMETTEKWIQSNCFVTTTNPYQLKVVPRFALNVEIDKLRTTIRYTKTS